MDGVPMWKSLHLIVSGVTFRLCLSDIIGGFTNVWANYAGVGYLTGRRMALKGDHPNRVWDPNSVTEIISRGRRKHLCRILLAFTQEKFWIHAVIPRSKRRSFWRMAPWAERLFRAERPLASMRRSNYATTISTASWARAY